MLYFEKKKYIRLIKLTKEKLNKTQKIITNFYNGIDVIVRNVRTMPDGSISINHSYNQLNRIFRLKILANWNENYYFNRTLEKIGTSKFTIEAYFHGFLNTYFFERKERNLIEILKEYTLILKNLNNEPVKFICWHCKEEVYTIEKNVEYPLKCPVCPHYPMYLEHDIKSCRE